MTGFTPLLVHSATLYTLLHVNTNGRLTSVKERIGDVRCRFTQPTPSSVTVSNGPVENKISATIYVGPETAAMMLGYELPLLIKTDDNLWKGEYEIRSPPRVYESYSALHHAEIDVVRVNHDISR